MKSSAAILIAAAVAWATLSVVNARGVILTAPRSLERNVFNKLYLSLYDVNAAGTVDIMLRTKPDDSIVAGTVVDVQAGDTEKVIDLKVPANAPYSMKIWVNGTFDTSDRYSIYEVDEVYTYDTRRSVITFIQTDKPLYKPGQQVRFRVLPLDRYLKPLARNAEGEVWTEDTAGSRIAQWKNVSFGQGIQQFEFPLSEEPPLGRWKIKSRVGGVDEVAYFEVKEYVLPKFEVTITPPSYVLESTEMIAIEICAKYTYGKQVQGNLKINSTLKTWGYDKFPVLEIEEKIDGCYTYQLNATYLEQGQGYHYRRIQVSAEVTEDGTGVTRSSSQEIERKYMALHLQFLDDKSSQYFKPGMPYNQKIKVTRPDDTAAASEEIEVCATILRQRILQQWWATRKVKYCRNYTSDEYGIIRFEVPPPTADVNSLDIEAKSLAQKTPTTPRRPYLSQPSVSKRVQSYYSPSNSYIQVQNTGETVQCGASRNIRIFYTAQEGAKYVFHYTVISKGQVVDKGSKEVAFTSADDIGATGTLCKGPLSVNDVRILVFPSTSEVGHIEEENSDCSSGPIGSVEISVDVTSALSPSFSFLVYYIRNDDETVADSTKFQVEKCLQNRVELQFGDDEKQPGAKTSLTLKASPNSLCGTRVVDKSINLLDSSNQLTKEKVFQELQNLEYQPYYWDDHCNDAFRKGGKNKIAFSPIPPSSRRWSYSEHADAVTAFEVAGFVVLSDLKLFTRPCSTRDYSNPHYVAYSLEDRAEMRSGEAAMPAPRPVAVPMESRSRHFPPPSAATESLVDIRSFFPETWLFDMKTVGEEGELVSDVTLPHTITEWLGNAVCVNEEDGLGVSDIAKIRGFQAFFLEFTLPYSVIRGERVPLTISIFNYLDKCLPISRTIGVIVISDAGTIVTETSNAEDVCVCGGKTDTFKLMFTPDHVGTLNLTVLALSARSSSVCGDQDTADVEARDMATTSVIVEAEGFPQERVNSFMFCPEVSEESTYTERLELNVPDNAVQDSARAFISVSGSIMGPSIDGLDRLVRLPTGCGEQNMVLFTPNIVALDYLTSIGKLPEEVRNRAIKNLQTGYQRELKYRHLDGSYSAFGGADREGSMWLSAFVLKSFSQARRYINIDAKDIDQTAQWILQKQQADGCFPKVGMVFSQGMKGGLASQGENVTAPLTAYVLSALLTSGYNDETYMNRALACIASDASLTPYTAALYGYATALANRSEADRYLAWLAERAVREGDEVYWRNAGGSKSLDVETAAYAVLTVLKRKGEAGLYRALSTVRHLTKMRNSNGGFVSTQDTVVGLEAVSQFASGINRNTVELTVQLNGEELDETVIISEENKLLVKRSRVPMVPSVIDVTAAGSGCGLLQAALRYNTLETRGERFFSLSVSAARKEGCKKAAISVCARYLPENQKSNMALVEIKMVSGFAADRDTLQTLLNNNEANLKRYEIENNNVVFYFEELSNDNACFSFDVEEAIDVEERKPATAKVYDYYAKENEESVSYTIAASC